MALEFIILGTKIQLDRRRQSQIYCGIHLHDHLVQLIIDYIDKSIYLQHDSCIS